MHSNNILKLFTEWSVICRVSSGIPLKKAAWIPLNWEKKKRFIPVLLVSKFVLPLKTLKTARISRGVNEYFYVKTRFFYLQFMVNNRRGSQQYTVHIGITLYSKKICQIFRSTINKFEMFQTIVNSIHLI